MKIFAVAVIGVMFASCDLNLLPNSAIAYDEDGQLIQTQSNLDSFENGILSSYRSYQNGGFVISEEVMFDAFNATVDFGNNYGALHKTDYNFTPSDYDVEDFWSYSYGAIKDYNIIIAAADNVPDAIKAKAQVVKGEAFFFRAATYLNLARHFGKAYNASSASSDPCVPLVTVYNMNDKPARATVKEVYDQVKADLDSAAVKLAGVKGAANSIKPTIDAVNALYARYYIDIADNANAAVYAHKLIDSGTYTLASTAAEMADVYVNDKGSEAIFQMAISLTEFTGNNFSVWTGASSHDVYTEVFSPLYIPTKTLVDSYDAADLRLAAWFDNTVTVRLAGGFYTGDFYTFTKFRGNPALTSSPIRNARQAPKPFKISEMYLIAAEAELVTDATAAKADLNALQTARGANTTEASTATVQKEWFRETVGEGLRMSCVKRWGIGFNGRPAQSGAINLIQQGEAFNEKVFSPTSNYLQWPIPSHELKINKNLTQNPGYEAE